MIMFICFFIINIMDNSLWDTLHEDLQKKIIKIRDDELEYDTKLLKLSNDFVRQYISDYMRSKGRRITNLNTANKTNLLSLFKKFKIPKIPYDIVVKDKEKIKKYQDITIDLEIECNSFDFSLSTEIKKDIINQGYLITKSQIIKKYNYLLDKPKLLLKE